MQAPYVDAVKRALSRERFAGYCGGGSDVDGVVNFLWNADLAQSLYPVLQALEVALRNALYDAVAAAYPDAGGGEVPCWLDAEPPILLAAEVGKVREAKRRIVQSKRELEPGRLVAELSFGFWTALFDVRYESSRVLWPRLFREQPFAGVPRRMRTRKELSALFNRVRMLRNRAFHHEPIWHWGDLAGQHALAAELLGWLNPEFRSLLVLVDRFGDAHAAGRHRIRSDLGRFTVVFRGIRTASNPKAPPPVDELHA